MRRVPLEPRYAAHLTMSEVKVIDHLRHLTPIGRTQIEQAAEALRERALAELVSAKIVIFRPRPRRWVRSGDFG